MICRICDSPRPAPVLDLGLQPWGNHFLKKEEVGHEPTYPLRLEYCPDCCCAQLDYTVPKEVMFSDHTYVSGTTKTLAQHFADTASLVDRTFLKDRTNKRVLDIGSNDGTQLKQYQALGFEALGVESCQRVAEMAIADHVPTVIDYFNDDCVQRIGKTFDIVNASGVFFHLEELHSAARGVKRALADDGVFVVQFLYMKSIMENLAFDQLYHEHLLYYTLRTITRLLNRHGLSPFDAYLAPIHGGSMILFATHTGRRSPTPRWEQLVREEEEANTNAEASYLAFAKRVVTMKNEVLAFLQDRKRSGKRIFGFGAPVKGNTFLNYCGIGTQYLDCLVEKNPLRRGLYSPGMHIPILLEDELTAPPDVYFVLAWNFKREILKNNQALINKGVEFYFPVDTDRPPQRATR